VQEKENSTVDKKPVEPEVVEKKESKNGVNVGPIAIQHNHYYPTPVDPKALLELVEKSPELADRYLKLHEEALKNIKEFDDRVLSLEEKEQILREEDIPYRRRYTFRAQTISAAIVFVSLGVSVFFGLMGMEKAAIATILIPIGVVAVNFLGIRNKGQK
jgi:hypothetical protein